MGRNKYSQSEFDAIARLLSLKGSANRAKQKEIRHQLRVGYEFNISDFNEPGKAFGLKELLDARQRGAIVILDDRTIADMKAKRERDKQRDAEQKRSEEMAEGTHDEAADWQKAMKDWEDYYSKHVKAD